MQTIEINFTDAATPEMKSALLALIERTTTLDEIFEEWFLKQGNRFGLSLAVDDDDHVVPDAFSLFFDTNDGAHILSALVQRRELTRAYPQVAPFNVFVKGWREEYPVVQLHEMKYERWLKHLGFVESKSLMSLTGSRGAAIQLMVSFALSGNGIAEAWHIDPADPGYEDYELDLAEEGVDLKDYFYIQTCYERHPGVRNTNRTLFHPFYCKKAA